MQPIKLDPSIFTTAEQFHAYFSMIPESKWCCGFEDNEGRGCAITHLGRANAKAINALYAILGSVWGINDGWMIKYTQDTPKQRILAALRDKFGGAQ